METKCGKKEREKKRQKWKVVDFFCSVARLVLLLFDGTTEVHSIRYVRRRSRATLTSFFFCISLRSFWSYWSKCACCCRVLHTFRHNTIILVLNFWLLSVGGKFILFYSGTCSVSFDIYCFLSFSVPFFLSRSACVVAGLFTVSFLPFILFGRFVWVLCLAKNCEWKSRQIERSSSPIVYNGQHTLTDETLRTCQFCEYAKKRK